MRTTPWSRVALIGTAMAAAACRAHGPAEPPPQTVRAGVVERVQPTVPERYSAVIAPIAQVELAFKSAGPIERLHQVRGADGRMRGIEVGDRVTKGTELAAVRAADYTHALEQARGRAAEAAAQLTQARAAFDQADADYTRARNLFDAASLVKPQLDQAKARFDSARANVDAAQAGVAGAQAAVDSAALALDDASVRAPFDGWIAARNVDVGALAGPTTVAFSLVDSHLVKAVFAVPDSSLRAVRQGQRQTVTLDTVPHPVDGVVTSISPQADPRTRVFAVEVTLDNPREEIRPGMIAGLTIGAAADATPRLVVPLSAVVRAPADPAGFAVFRIADRDGATYARAQVVQVGQSFGNAIEVHGLAPGDRVIALGASLVHDGQRVNVLP